MDPIDIVAVVTAVLAASSVAWWWAARRDRTTTAAEDATRTGSGGPVTDQLKAAPRRPRPERSSGVFDPDGLPLSRDFLPEQGDPPPVERDVFAELARRRMRETDA